MTRWDASADSGRPAGRQQHILAVIRQWVQDYGYPPTVREIGDAVGLTSPSSVTYHLDALERQGQLRRGTGPRAIHLPGAHSPVADRADIVRVPLVGSIAAGTPIVADENVEDVLTLPTTLVGAGTLFALHVRGDSMIEAAIHDGDIVVVRQQPTAESGEIVAALIGDEATVKVLRVRGRSVQLHPRNPAYPVISAAEASILGKVVALLRNI